MTALNRTLRDHLEGLNVVEHDAFRGAKDESADSTGEDSGDEHIGDVDGALGLVAQVLEPDLRYKYETVGKTFYVSILTIHCGTDVACIDCV